MANNILAQMSVVLGAQTKDFESGMARARAELSGFKKAGEQMKDLGENMSKWLSAPLAGLAAISLKTAGDIEALKKGLTAVAGSAEGAEKQFSSLKEVAKLPGLGLEEAIQGSINLQAAGFSAEQAEGALKGFGNALATVGKGKAELDGVTTALAQMAAKGKISAEEINQIAGRVPQIRKIMEKAFGTSNTEELQKMGISAEEFVSKVNTELAKLPPVTGGLNNAFENMADAGKLAFANLGDTINKTFNIEGILNSIADTISGLAESFKNLSPETQKFIVIGAAIVAAIGPVLLAFGALSAAIPTIVAGFTLLAGAAAAITGPIFLIGLAVAAAVALIIKNWDSIVAYFTTGPGVAVFEALSAQVKKAFNIISTVFDIFRAAFTGDWGKLWIGIKNLAAIAINGVIDNLVLMATAIPRVLSALLKGAGVNNAFTKGLDSVSNAVIGVAESFKLQTQEIYKNTAAVEDAVKTQADAAKKSETFTRTPKGGGKAKTRKGGKEMSGLDFAGHESGLLVLPAQIDLLPIPPESFTEVTDPLIQPILDFSKTMSDAVSGLLVNSFVSLGEAIGGAFSGGTGGMDAFFNGILMSIMDFASMMGKQLIALGVAKIALDRLFEFTGGGALAIAAGVALVAIAGAAKSSMSKGSKSIGSGATASAPRSSSPSYSGASGGGGYGANDYTLSTKISGADLQVILSKQDYRNSKFGR